jgi:hypothetical protein
MTFTYNLASTDADIVLISKVRLEIGDKAENKGVYPDRTNLTDEEIAVWLDEEGDDYHLAAARACEALSRIWATSANSTTRGVSDSYMTVSGNWAKRAKELRERYGGGDQAFSVGMTRVDGYSEAAGSTDYAE